MLERPFRERGEAIQSMDSHVPLAQAEHGSST